MRTSALSVVLVLLLRPLLVAGAPAAAAPPLSFDVVVNLDDRNEVRAAAGIADDKTQELRIDATLRIQLRVEATTWGGRWVSATVLEDIAGFSRALALLDWPQRPDEPHAVQRIAFSRCGERFIGLRGATPGRCVDLPPMASADALLGACGMAGALCLGPYEGMPAAIASRARLAPVDEPGEPLTIAGRVLGPDGRPRADVIVYGYQTDRTGAYPPATPPRSLASHFHGRLRGWARSDAQGRYSFETIRPGAYGGNPEHVHLHVVEPGCATYVIDDLIFEDDPDFVRLTADQQRSITPGRGGTGIAKLHRRGTGWSVTRDVHLGQGIPGYFARPRYPCDNIGSATMRLRAEGVPQPP